MVMVQNGIKSNLKYLSVFKLFHSFISVFFLSVFFSSLSLRFYCIVLYRCRSLRISYPSFHFGLKLQRISSEGICLAVCCVCLTCRNTSTYLSSIRFWLLLMARQKSSLYKICVRTKEENKELNE